MASCLIFHTQGQERMKITSTGNIGIGTISPSYSIESHNEWQKILELSETNPAVKLALDKLKTTYYLSKQEDDSKT